jgi:hypothetical protein
MTIISNNVNLKFSYHLNVGCNEVLSRNAIVSTMDGKTKVSRVFDNNLQGSRLRGRPKAEDGTVSKNILRSAKLQIGMGGQKRRLLVEVH